VRRVRGDDEEGKGSGKEGQRTVESPDSHASSTVVLLRRKAKKSGEEKKKRSTASLGDAKGERRERKSVVKCLQVKCIALTLSNS
jgi:hypothetical protein